MHFLYSIPTDTRDEPPIRMVVSFDHEPGRPGRMYLSNGDPGYPDEPASVDITDTRFERLVDGKWVDLGFTLPGEVLDKTWAEQRAWNTVNDADDARLADLAEAREHARELEDWNP